MTTILLSDKDSSLPFKYLPALLFLHSIRLLPGTPPPQPNYLTSVSRIEELKDALRRMFTASSSVDREGILRNLRNDREYQAQLSYEGASVLLSDALRMWNHISDAVFGSMSGLILWYPGSLYSGNNILTRAIHSRRL